MAMGGQIRSDFGGIYDGLRVLVTGHTGFKGGWLSLWLKMLGADVWGVALRPDPGPSLFGAIRLGDQIDSRFADINDVDALAAATAGIDADLVIHLAAQSIVRQSYAAPVETFMTNVIGTAHVLESVRRMPSLKAAIVVTSDKCYENKEWVWGYRENDPMGGADPYSASKGCTELLTASYRRSFFADPEGPLLASARAGNVFGGGDWAVDRLIPDIMRGKLTGEPVRIRNPASIRPWQHVLEPLCGYLALGERLLAGGAGYAEGWNFGPDVDGIVDVRTLAEAIADAWGDGAPKFVFQAPLDAPAEARTLRLDSTKAATRLGWRPQLKLNEAVSLTVDWYRRNAAGEDMTALMQRQIAAFGQRMAGYGTEPLPDGEDSQGQPLEQGHH